MVQGIDTMVGNAQPEAAAFEKNARALAAISGGDWLEPITESTELFAEGVPQGVMNPSR